MAKDWLAGVKSDYDVVVIGSGLGGLIKSCSKYWTREIADSIEQLKDI